MALVAGGTASAVAAVPRAAPVACPTASSAPGFPDQRWLGKAEGLLAALKARPTGSPEQAAYIAWIRRQLRTIPGLQVHDLTYPIDRWRSNGASLQVRMGGRTRTLPPAGPIPYSKPTDAAGVEAPAVAIPDDQQITAANSRGRIVVRDAPAGSVPNAAFLLPVVSWEVYDPNHTIDPTGNFLGDFINYNARVTDLRDAAAAGAAGILFVKPLPRAQIDGHYEPYEGEQWGVPGAFLGADEGKVVTDAIAAGQNPVVRLVNRAVVRPVTTPSIEAVLPGQSPQRIVVDSHTDGTNANEDNGPIAMVAMARYLSRLPLACRPRSVQFSFTTAHFYQRVGSDKSIRDGGAEQLAEQLDRDYDRGTVSSVMTIEHLGAMDWEQAPRRDGGPGFQLTPMNQPAIRFIGVTPSPSMVAAVDAVVRGYDLQRTIVLQGADAPGATNPSHCTFGGEATPYERHLLPTIGEIAAPQYLYDPAFEMQVIDLSLMHREVVAFTDLLLRLQRMSQSDVAGAIPAERALRAAGFPACPSDGA